MNAISTEYKDELVYKSIKSRVYCRTYADGVKQIVKVLNIELPTPSEIKNFNNEYEILSHLPVKGVRKGIEKTREKNHHVLIFEYVKGETVQSIFKYKKSRHLTNK